MRGNKYISSTETSGSHTGKKSDLMTNSLTRIFCDGETKTLVFAGSNEVNGSGLVTQRRTSAAAGSTCVWTHVELASHPTTSLKNCQVKR